LRDPILKIPNTARCRWLTSIILVSQEAEIRRFKASPGKQFVRPYLENYLHKEGLVEWLKTKALSSSPSTAKKKKEKRKKKGG
jgi:hypothetical protein